MKITRKFKGRIVPKGLTRKKGRIAWNKGIPMSLEQRKKLSLAKIGKKITIPRKASMAGKHHSQETKDKIRLSKLGKKCPWNIGKLHTQEAKEKMSTLLKESFAKGERIPFWTGKKRNDGDKLKFSNSHKGKTLSAETKAKLSILRRREKHWAWISDRTQVKLDTERGGPLHKQWSKDVKNRDGWECKIFNNTCKGKIVAHHILSWRDYPELHYKLNNGITLCHAHHPRVRAEEKRLENYFMGLVSVSKKTIWL